MVVHCLLHDGAGPLFNDAAHKRDVDEVFKEIDADRNGLIEFGEFKDFYDATLETTRVAPESDMQVPPV
jgi:hypothetical protein